MFTVHVHCIVFVTILYYGMFTLYTIVIIDQDQKEINYYL